MMTSCSVSYSTLTASVQSHCFNNSNIDPAAKNQNAVIFNTFKKADSPHYLRLLLADWPRCGTKVATTHCWLQTKRTDSYAELSSRSARICEYTSTYITFGYSEEIKFLYCQCVLEEHAAVEVWVTSFSSQQLKVHFAPRPRPGSADAETHTPRYAAR